MEQDLNDILIFTRVVEENSFTGASKILGFPKSTVSRRISRLEDQLGVRLLQRTTRKLSLTDAGQVYYERSARIISELEDAGRAVSSMQEIPTGRLRITAPIEYGSGMWELLFHFMEKYPEVHIELDLTNRYVNMVEEGYDIAIRGGELSDSSLIARKLRISDFILVASPEYLERKGEPQKIEELKEHDCLLFGNRSNQNTWSLHGKKGLTHIRVKGRLTVNHLGVLRRAALFGYGIALVPEMFVSHDLESGALKKLLCGTGPHAQGLHIVYPSTRHLAPKVRAFVDFLILHHEEYLQAIIYP